MRRIAAACAAALVLAACSTAGRQGDWADLKSNPREFFNLDAPVRVVDAAAAGTTVALRQGEALVVRLPEDPASGLVWRLRPLPQGSVVAPVQRDLAPKPGTDPAAAGAGGEATFRLRAVAPGTQAVTIDHVRPGVAAPERSLAFDVAVR